MVSSSRQSSDQRMLLVAFLAGGMLFGTAPRGWSQNHSAQPAASRPQTAASPDSSNSASTSSGTWHALQSPYYKRKWGVDVIGVRIVSSGEMLRFSYQILDPEKAKPLLDKRWNPYLVDEASGAKLGIPEMEKVGKLRQTGPAEEGRIYWMVFGNPNQLVKRGSRVDVVIGSFRADGIVVE